MTRTRDDLDRARAIHQAELRVARAWQDSAASCCPGCRYRASESVARAMAALYSVDASTHALDAREAQCVDAAQLTRREVGL